MAGSRQETVFAREGQKARMETDQVAIMLGHRSCQIVIPEFACDPAQVMKGMNVAAHESFKALAVSELHIELAAVAFHQAEGVELARVALVSKHTEMAPVDLEALAGPGLHAHMGTLGLRVGAYRVQVLFQDTQAAIEAQPAEPLCNDYRTDFRVLLQQLRDRGFEGIQFAGALPRSGRACGCGQVPGDGSASEVKMTCDLAHRPVLGEGQAMNGVDLLCRQHAFRARYKTDRSPRAGRGPSYGKIRTCAEAKLFLSRSCSLGPTSQTSEAECFRSKAKLFLTRRCRRRF